MSTEQYIDAFTNYLHSGDLSVMKAFCENPNHISRLAVYRNGFYKGCIDALSANFPMCEKSLGTESFREMARLYVDHFPPKQGTLVGYGLTFPDFLVDLVNDIVIGNINNFALTKNQQSIQKTYSNLVHIAQLDYAWLMSLMSTDSNQTLTTENVTQILEQEVELTELNVNLNPSVILVNVREEAFTEWISLKTNNDDVLACESLNDAFVMLWRLQGEVQARLLSIAEIALMQSLQGTGGTLGEAFDAALVIDENFDVSDAFTACLQNELLEIKIN